MEQLTLCGSVIAIILSFVGIIFILICIIKNAKLEVRKHNIDDDIIASLSEIIKKINNFTDENCVLSNKLDELKSYLFTKEQLASYIKQLSGMSNNVPSLQQNELNYLIESFKQHAGIINAFCEKYIESEDKIISAINSKDFCFYKEQLEKYSKVPQYFLDSLQQYYDFIMQLYNETGHLDNSLPIDEPPENIFSEIQNWLEQIKNDAGKLLHVEGENNKKDVEIVSLNNQIENLNSEKSQYQEEVQQLEERLEGEKTKHQEEVQQLEERLEGEKTKHQEEIQRIQKQQDGFLTNTRQDHTAEIEKLKQEYQGEIENQGKVLAALVPMEILDLFDMTYGDFNSRKLMVVYSYLSLLRDTREGVFIERFRSFDRDLLVAVNTPELTDVRSKVEAHLNGKLTVFCIHWSKPGERFNPGIHFDSTGQGQIISKVNTAVIYRKNQDGKEICSTLGKVETR